MATQSSSLKDGKSNFNLSDVDLRGLRLVSDHGSAPVDLMASYAGVSVLCMSARVRSLARKGLLVLDNFETEPYPWPRLTPEAARRHGLRARLSAPKPDSLNHRRGVIVARLDIEARFPGGTWGLEGDIVRREGQQPDRPDGEYYLGRDRWAIEVERSRKSVARVAIKVLRLLGGGRYQRLVYQCSAEVLPFLQKVQKLLGDDRLEVCKLQEPEWMVAPPRQRAVKGPAEISEKRRKLLALITEEGLVAVDQLAELVGCTRRELAVDLRWLRSKGLLERAFGFRRRAFWVWATHSGARESGTGLRSVDSPGSARLHRRRAMMSIRLSLMGIGGHRGSWKTRRMLGKGLARGVPFDLAIWKFAGRETAVLLTLEANVGFKRTLELITTLSRERDEVLWYCSAANYEKAASLAAREGWGNVGVIPVLEVS